MATPHHPQVRFSSQNTDAGIELGLMKAARPRSLTFSLDTLGEERSNNERSKPPEDESGEDHWSENRSDYENLPKVIEGGGGGGGTGGGGGGGGGGSGGGDGGGGSSSE